jgi:uncharacterized protein YjeT (DUF2065 family)
MGVFLRHKEPRTDLSGIQLVLIGLGMMAVGIPVLWFLGGSQFVATTGLCSILTGFVFVIVGLVSAFRRPRG